MHAFMNRKTTIFHREYKDENIISLEMNEDLFQFLVCKGINVLK